MTREEAIKHLKEITGWANFWGGCYNDKLCAIDMAIADMEKQIPKKPFRDKDNSNFWTCPYCKEEMYWDTDYGQQKFRYCNQCGQALDWSEERE